MHKIFFLLPSAGGELDVICFYSKLYLKVMNPFSWIGTSWPFIHVFTLLIFHISCLCFPSILVFFYIFWLLHVLIFNNFLCAVIFNGGAFLVSLVFILNDVVTWVVFPVLWVLIFTCILFDDFFLLYIFSAVVIVLVFLCWYYPIVFILGLVVFVCYWDTWASLKNWIPLGNLWMLILSVQIVYPVYDLIIYV